MSGATSTSRMLEFTCICCQVAFADGDVQRMHYKTDWHRYNLKRKVADLPPITSEEFQRRVLQQRSNDEAAVQDTSRYCKCCRKHFSNIKAYDNHLNSKRHRDNERDYVEEADDEKLEEKGSVDKKIETMSVDSDSEVEEVDSDEWDEAEVDNKSCLFCKFHSGSFTRNLTHMSIAHSFFFPDIDYVTDIYGLFEYLSRKIDEGFMCLWCNEKGRTFHSADAARSHMLDKGHCKMLHEGIALAEYADYYDYSASYPDADKEEINADEEVEVPELEGNEYQLVLPSGAVIGHRSLMRYYKQSIDPGRAVVAVSKSTRKLHKVLAHYRALGWTAAHQEAAAKKARDLHYMKRMQSKYNMRLGVKGNKLQTHFRQQVNF